MIITVMGYPGIDKPTTGVSKQLPQLHVISDMKITAAALLAKTKCNFTRLGTFYGFQPHEKETANLDKAVCKICVPESLG